MAGAGDRQCKAVARRQGHCAQARQARLSLALGAKRERRCNPDRPGPIDECKPARPWWGNKGKDQVSQRPGSKVRDDQVKEKTYLGHLVRTHKLTKHQASNECGFSSVGRTCSGGATWTTRYGDKTRLWSANGEEAYRRTGGKSMGCDNGATGRPDQVKMARQSVRMEGGERGDVMRTDGHGQARDNRLFVSQESARLGPTGIK